MGRWGAPVGEPGGDIVISPLQPAVTGRRSYNGRERVVRERSKQSSAVEVSRIGRFGVVSQSFRYLFILFLLRILVRVKLQAKIHGIPTEGMKE